MAVADRGGEVMKKSYILVLVFCLTLGSCATTKSDWQKTILKTKTEQLNFPELDTEISRALGDTLAEKGYKSTKPAIEILSEWTMKRESTAIPAYLVPEGKEGELHAIWSSLVSGERVECYEMEFGYPFHWNYLRGGEGYNIPFFLCERSDGSFAPMQLLDESLNPADSEYSTIPPNSPILRKFDKVSLSDPSYVQQIIYNGRVGDYLKFIYREFSGDYIRPAFTQDIQYDLGLSNVIGFKTLRLKVLDATNTEIRYELISNF